MPAVETPVHYCLAVDDFLEWAVKARSSLSRSLIVGEVAEVDRKLEETQVCIIEEIPSRIISVPPQIFVYMGGEGSSEKK